MGAITPLTVGPDPLEPLWVPDTVRAMCERSDSTFAVPVGLDLIGLWLRRDALISIGGRAPRDWGVSYARWPSAHGTATRGQLTVRHARGVCGSNRNGSCDVAASGRCRRRVWRSRTNNGRRNRGDGLAFLRTLIDTALMTADVVGFTTSDVVGALRSGRAVAGVATSSALADDANFVFTGFPGSARSGLNTTTLAVSSVGVVMTQSRNREPAERKLAEMRDRGFPSCRPRSAGDRSCSSGHPVLPPPGGHHVRSHRRCHLGQLDSRRRGAQFRPGSRGAV